MVLPIGLLVLGDPRAGRYLAHVTIAIEWGCSSGGGSVVHRKIHITVHLSVGE